MRTQRILCGALLLIASAFGVGLLFYSFTVGIESIPFDKAQWTNRERIAQAPYIRLQMIHALLTQHPLTGMSREQVSDLLGEPESTDYFSDYDLVYWLGLERGFIRIDSEWLVIKLDDEQRVSTYQIRSD